jgi:hypothetical protein
MRLGGVGPSFTQLLVSCGNDSPEGNMQRPTLSTRFFPLFFLSQCVRPAEALTVFLEHYHDYNTI